jgi:hypothetical protein
VTWAADTVGSMRRHHSVLGLGALLASSTACERTHELLPPVVMDGGSDAQGDGAVPPYFNDAAGVFMCTDHVCACSNQDDDDGDTFTDGFDPECTGPYDDDELTFATGMTKEGNPHCADCFFDSNAGSGDDGCSIPERCTQGTDTGGTGMCRTCTPDEKCMMKCLPRTPNGCDCFGCCQIEDGMQSDAILLADTCSMTDLADPIKCPRCVLNLNYDPVTSAGPCFNPCERCELCAGKTVVDSDCGDGDVAHDCEGGAEVCGGTNVLCGELAWCIQGCCAPLLY